jgi:circadian clock protein KaiC
LLKRSVPLVSGSVGTGKSTMGLHFIATGAAQKEPGLFVSLDEGPEQVARNAKALGIPWDEGGAARLIQSLYLSPENVRSSQFFSLLGDHIRAQKTRRLVLDGAAYLANTAEPFDELREMLLVLVSQFKLLDVTTLVMVESAQLYSTETIPDRSFASVADNLVMLRYELEAGALKPYIMVVKAHDSAHDPGCYTYALDNHGMAIQGRVSPSRATPRKAEET